MNRQTMKEKAKASIKGKVIYSFLIIFVAALPASISFPFYTGENSFLVSLGGILTFIGTYVAFIFRYGVASYFNNIANQREGGFEGFIEPFNKKFAFEMFKARFIADVYIVIGLILLIVPGIYFALKYSQIEYAFLEDPNLKYKEALERSAKIMKGNFVEYIVLLLSFIGWVLLVGVTFGILSIYVLPYVEGTKLQFYYAKSDNIDLTQKDFEDKSEVLIANVEDIYEMDDSDPFE